MEVATIFTWYKATNIFHLFIVQTTLTSSTSFTDFSFFEDHFFFCFFSTVFDASFAKYDKDSLFDDHFNAVR